MRSYLLSCNSVRLSNSWYLFVFILQSQKSLNVLFISIYALYGKKTIEEETQLKKRDLPEVDKVKQQINRVLVCRCLWLFLALSRLYCREIISFGAFLCEYFFFGSRLFLIIYCRISSARPSQCTCFLSNWNDNILWLCALFLPF